MKVQNPDSVLQAIPRPPIILMRSNHPERSADFLQRLCLSFFAPLPKTKWHIERHNALQLSIDNLAERVSISDLFAPKKIIYAVGIENFAASNKLDSSLLERLLPSSDTLLLWETKNLDPKFWWVSHSNTNGVIVDLDAVSGFVSAYAKRLGLDFDSPALEYFKAMVGEDESLQLRALEKLHIALHNEAASPSVRVQINDINRYIASTSMGDAFALLQAIFQQNAVKMQEILQKLKQHNEAPLRLLGLIAWQSRIILKARILLDKGASTAYMQTTLRQYGQNLQNTLAIARRNSLNTHFKRLSTLSEIDHLLKQSNTQIGWLFLEEALLQFATPKTYKF